MNRSNMRGRSIRRWPTELNVKMLRVAFKIMSNMTWHALYRIERYQISEVKLVQARVVPGRVVC